MANKEGVNKIIKDMKEDTLLSLKIKTCELHKVTKPIQGGTIGNGGKPSYKDSMEFVRDGGFKKSYELLQEIVKCHNYLAQFY